jgi:hypothetical protein
MAAAQRDVAFDVIAVDDGSTALSRRVPRRCRTCARAASMCCTSRATSGTSGASAIGLTEADARARHLATIVMDSDGEDRPDVVPTLVAALRGDPRRIVVARRARRSEGLVFGSSTRYTSSSSASSPARHRLRQLLRAARAERESRLVAMPEIWNNLAAAIRTLADADPRMLHRSAALGTRARAG